MEWDKASMFSGKFREVASSRCLVECPLLEMEVGPLSLWCSQPWEAGLPTGLVTAGIHGDEPAGPLAIFQYLQHFSLPEGFNWILAPLLNPHGWNRGVRTATEDIDLNRDFLQLRCPESRAFCQWWDSRRHGCDFHLSLHEDWETSGLYMYEINTTGRPGYAGEVLAAVGACHPLQTEGPVDDHVLARPGLILHPPVPDEPEGWPEAIWLCRRFPVLSHTWESPSSKPLSERISMLICVLQAEFAHLTRGGG